MVPEKMHIQIAFFGTKVALFAFAQFSCALHQSFEKQPNVGQRHRLFVILS